ncbi:hypothetical protein [Metasolibacillus sp.]|uniref:hypothetical protein n=1 Tax=Metasolibacillus sp. TaxID=2703680 RepID=UPI0025CD6EE2|nr:hypothetical protein [Metasolibacillus sp.]MCT6924603.1 hypothetical protein [Metasolibacillus sp.]MCT6940805.1 hypothetical protein [Metasolibacillus sp.]
MKDVLKPLLRHWELITMDIEHPDITHVNRTGYTREQWRAIHRNEVDNEHDKSEWDDHEDE